MRHWRILSHGPGDDRVESTQRRPSVLFLTLAEIAERAAFLAPRAGRGQQAPSENRNSARWGRFRESELVETLTGPRLGFLRCRAALSPHAGRGMPRQDCGTYETSVRVGTLVVRRVRRRLHS